MQIKRYETKNLQEVSVRIKRDLGPNAIILSTKQISSDPPLIEVMAARDEKSDHSLSADVGARQKEPQRDASLSSIAREIQELKSSIDGLTRKASYPCDLSDLMETMNLLLDKMSATNPKHLCDLYIHLIANGLSRSRSLRLIEEIKKNYPCADRDTYEQCVAIAETLIARSLVTDDRKERRIRAFIGPTGVGKTTTLAKLAAHYSIEKKMKVGLITTDTYRIAASEQLKVYAKIMGLPIHIASEKDVFLRAMMDFAEKDMILVDTPGRNHHDGQCLSDIKNILGSGVESVLLLSPVANREYLLDTADRFKLFSYDRIILTKVDECSHFGSLYDVLDEIGKPVSHVTTGQNVPKDIKKASPERLARMILQNRLN